MSKIGSILKISAMTVGAAGGLLSAYSVYTDGNMHARKATKDSLSETYLDMYQKSLSSSRESHLLEKVKSFFHEQMLDDSVYPFVLNMKNHITGWCGQIIDNIIPIGLSAIAVLTPGFFKKHEVKVNGKIGSINSFISKVPLVNKLPKLPQAEKLGILTSAVSAVLLLLGSGQIFFNDVLGIGKEKM